MLMFTFHDSILFWSLHTRELVKNSLFSKKISKGQLLGIIRPEAFNFGIKLSFNHIEKSGNYKLDIRLMFNQENPSKSGTIIHKSDKVSMSMMITNMKRTLYITMNQFKGKLRNMIIRKEWQTFLFSQWTNITRSITFRITKM